MLELLPDVLYAKTPQGSDEVATRRHGLGMRLRQLLILIDGRRSVGDLAKLVPDRDLADHLAQLDSQGFVARIGPAGAAGAAGAGGLGGATAAATQPLARTASATEASGAGPPGPGLVAGARIDSAGGAPATATASPVSPTSPTSPTSATLATATPSVAAATDMPTPAHATAPAFAPAPVDTPVQRRDLETLRRAVVRHLVDAAGPFADDMAVRIERCRSVDELRQLLPSVAGMVEAVRGRAAMTTFLQKIGPI